MAINNDSMFRIGIDLGGTKIEGVVLRVDGSISLKNRILTPRDDYDGTVKAVVDLVHGFDGELGQRANVGMGIPGTISPHTNRIKNANATWLNGTFFARDVEKALGRPLKVANDANCFALSEAHDGAARGAGVVFGVILGTGTGGGIVVDGKVLEGANAIGGEWGHNPLPSPTRDDLPLPECYCGRKGCIETFLSGPGLSRHYEGLTGRKLEPPVVVKLANGGEDEAEEALKCYEDRLARGLASVINLLDPDVVVMGGGLSNIERLYTNVPELWARYIFSDHVSTRLVKAEHGDASGVRGAAWLCDS